jgi:hypothetical protein
VQLRAFIERARPIDKQLAYQIEKLLRATEPGGAAAAGAAAPPPGAGDGLEGEGAGAAAAAVGGDDDALRYRPNPSALVTKAPLSGGFDQGGLADAAGPSGVYRPPKLNPVAMEEDRAASRQERRAEAEARRRAKRRSGSGGPAEKPGGPALPCPAPLSAPLPHPSLTPAALPRPNPQTPPPVHAAPSCASSRRSWRARPRRWRR